MQKKTLSCDSVFFLDGEELLIGKNALSASVPVRTTVPRAE